ncbi:MAG TPA: hypothetical protein VH062_07640 [Polyangiaceae bacterium]|nr:hypothetical protein [Polyangiaceae bacterium]
MDFDAIEPRHPLLPIEDALEYHWLRAQSVIDAAAWRETVYFRDPSWLKTHVVLSHAGKFDSWLGAVRFYANEGPAFTVGVQACAAVGARLACQVPS